MPGDHIGNMTKYTGSEILNYLESGFEASKSVPGTKVFKNGGRLSRIPGFRAKTGESLPGAGRLRLGDDALS